MGLLDGKVVIITGASSGIGKASAIEAAKQGACVTLAARNIEAMQETVEKIKADGGKAIAVKCDVLLESDIDNVVETTVKEFGRIDGLANIAQAGMDTQDNMFEDATYEVAIQHFTGGPWADLLFIRKVAPYMKKVGGGRIVNVGSHSCITGYEGQLTYAIAKGGIEALTRNAAIHYGKDNILVNVIFPQAVSAHFASTEEGQKVIAEIRKTAPLGYLGEAPDVAPTVAFLLSDQCHYMTGQFIAVDGGIRFIA